MPRSPLAINAKAQANVHSSLKIDLERAAATGASDTRPGQLVMWRSKSRSRRHGAQRAGGHINADATLRILLRVLPAGAVAGWALHPLESAAFPRRTPKEDLRLASRKRCHCAWHWRLATVAHRTAPPRSYALAGVAPDANSSV
jgi:hypothetical protein